MQDIQTAVMQLIVSSGEARSKAMQAIGCAKEGNLPEARNFIQEAKNSLTKAHESQTDLIQEEAAGNVKEVTMLMAHAQDHLMNAITVIDMVNEFVDLYEKISKT